MPNASSGLMPPRAITMPLACSMVARLAMATRRCSAVSVVVANVSALPTAMAA